MSDGKGEPFVTALLHGLGGEKCTDRDGDRAGVWLPAESWKVLAHIINALPAVIDPASLKN